MYRLRMPGEDYTTFVIVLVKAIFRLVRTLTLRLFTPIVTTFSYYYI